MDNAIKIYLCVDQLEQVENIESLRDKLTQWVGVTNPRHAFIDEPEQQRLGVSIELNKTKQLFGPFKELYPIASEYSFDFVVGIDDEGSHEDLCYFGKEEGQPDPYQVACYLGIES